MRAWVRGSGRSGSVVGSIMVGLLVWLGVVRLSIRSLVDVMAQVCERGVTQMGLVMGHGDRWRAGWGGRC